MQALDGIDKLCALQNSPTALLPKMPSPLLMINHLSCQRGDKQLFADISFAVSEQQCWHVIGANGSGKTSLLRQIAGLVELDRSVAEQSIHWSNVATPDSANRFAFLGHTDGLKPELTALENLTFYAHYSRAPRSIDLDQILFDVGLLNCADLAVKHMSFGQRRRLSLARVLITNAKVWLLDEPLTGIDASGRELFIELFLQHLASGGAIILTHHQLLTDSPLSSNLHELRLGS